jgi:integrase
MGDDASLIVLEPSLPADRHPVAVYLARLPSPNSRRAMGASVALCADVLSAGQASADRLAWWLLRGQHTAAARAQLIQRCQAVSTVNHALAALRGVLRACARLHLMSHEDCADALAELEQVRGETLPAGRPLAPEELHRLYVVCEADQTPIGRRDTALLALLDIGGLRRAEAVGLDVRDYRDGVVSVRHAKGRKEREVPLDIDARRRMEAWLQTGAPVEPDRPLFCSVLAGGHLRPSRLSVDHVAVILQHRGEAAGLQPFTPHDLRRTCASELLDSGADVLTVQKILGHADPRTTQRYDRRPERAKAEAVARRADKRHEMEKKA